MIHSIKIKNFRTHEDTDVTLHEGVNAFLGFPDSGKTNILRAINWVVSNRPLGYRFHSNFAQGPTDVSLVVDDVPEGRVGFGTIVTLSKDGRGAEYTLTGKDKEVLKAIGSDVPDRVSAILGINDINLQHQHDQPFLIFSSAAEVAKSLNRITRLERVDEAASSMTTAINTGSKTLRGIELDMETVSRGLEKLSRLDELEAAVEELERFDATREKLGTDCNTLEQAIWRLEELTNKKLLYKKLEEFEKGLENAATLRVTVESLAVECDRLEGLIRVGVMSTYNLKSKQKDFAAMKKEFAAALQSMDCCPYCKFCKTPMKNHSLDELLEGI